jgi:hypothetical protein
VENDKGGLVVGKISLLLLIFSFALSAHAEYREPCTVVYTATGKSYRVTCLYVSGFELNQATTSLNYDSLATYAVVFWAQNQATVIRLGGINACGTAAFAGCVYNTYLGETGTDQEGRGWKVCGQNMVYC